MNARQRRTYRRSLNFKILNEIDNGKALKKSFFISDNAPLPKENYYKDLYEDTLNKFFSEKPEVYKFDSNNTDEDIDKFFDSI